jgi:adenosylcobinamide-phosphate synthase
MGNWTLLAACGLDLLCGDPQRWPHPVIAIGGLIRFLEDKIYGRLSDPRISGLLLVILTLVATGASGWGMLAVAELVSPLLSGLVGIWLAYTCLALRSLHQQSSAVVEALAAGDPDEARSLLRMIVGRDTAQLDEQGILRACLETVAENTADGVIAPLCYLAMGGPVLGLLYKAVNTLDSMVGYRNERYREFGWASARLDDLANWLPARLTGALIAIAATILGLNGWQAWTVMRRDARKHASPNAGYPEAAAAGALGVQLGGPGRYFGEIVDKATLGDPDRQPDVVLFGQMVYLMYAASALGLGLLLGLRLLFA